LLNDKAVEILYSLVTSRELPFCIEKSDGPLVTDE